MDLTHVLITLLVLALIVWLCIWVIDMLPIPDVPKTIAKVIVAVIVLIKLLSMLGVGLNI